MKFAVTGTPGVGKTSACRFVTSLRVIHVNDLVEEFGLGKTFDKRRNTRVVDVEKLGNKVDRMKGDVIIEGHLAHLLHPEVAIVLRCSPRVLGRRLKAKGWAKEKVRENMEAEAVDVILIEALENVPTVLEIDTTRRKPRSVGQAIEEIVSGERQKYRVGNVDWSREVLSWF